MGRGNVCVSGKYEGLFYIDNDHIHGFRHDEPGAEDPETRLMGELDYSELTGGEWFYDEEGTMNEQEDIEECFMQDFTKMFPSFKRAGLDEWMPDGCRRILLESKLFYICVEDNQWSMALELIQKEEPWGLPWMENLQRQLHEKYLEGMKRCLLGRLPSIGTYKDAWRSGILTREEAGIFPVAVLRE